jgi:hypothetical protein
MAFALLGINLLIIMALWHFIVKKTLLDNARDSLFDLRDEIRRIHLERGFGISSDVYGNLRNMLNAYLMYTETYSVWSVVAVRSELSQSENAGLRNHMVARIDANFASATAEQHKYIANVRRRAANALIAYSVYSSGLLLIAAIIMTPYFMISTVLDQCRKGASALGAVIARDAMHLERVTAFVWALSIRWVASKVIDHQSIEVAVSNDKHCFT